MSQWTMTVGNNSNQSGNGMPRSGQTGKISNKNENIQKTVKANRQNGIITGSLSATSQTDMSEGVDVAITAGGRRVSQWLLAEDALYQQMMTNPQARTESASQNEIKTAKEILQEQVDVLLEKAEQSQEEMEAQAKEAAEKKIKEASGDSFSNSSVEYMEQLLESMKESRKASQEQKASQKRALNYNHRKVSGAIMRAKSVTQAGNALTSAKSNLSSLRRKANSGKYEDSEISIAVSHARKMIRTARKKLQNVKQEEQLEKRNDQLENTKEREHHTLARVRKKRQISENAESEKELLLLKKQLKQHENQQKNAHRREENHALLNADMEYLKKKIELMRQEQAMDKVAASEAARLQAAIAGGTTVEVSQSASGTEASGSQTTSASATSADAGTVGSSTASVNGATSANGAAGLVSTGFSALI